MNNFTIGCRVIAIKEHITEFPNPITTQTGEKVEFINKDDKGWYFCKKKNGEKGWIPKNYLEIQENTFIMKQDYDAREMNIKIDEEGEVKIIESGWCWVELSSGKSGWVPFECLKIIE